MEDKNSELLFEYLRSILYDKKIQPLDVEQLDEPFRKLGRGLQYFAKTFTETKQYAAALSRGNLSVQPPPRENFLCENLKNIHANLNHLTWQAKQVAKGDYSQTVSYLGEFSEAFNTMTQQLKERELKLKQEAEREKIHAGMVETYNQLLVEMIDRSDLIGFDAKCLIRPRPDKNRQNYQGTDKNRRGQDDRNMGGKNAGRKNTVNSINQYGRNTAKERPTGKKKTIRNTHNRKKK